MIVHNKHVTDAFEEDGIYTLDGTNRLEILKQVEKEPLFSRLTGYLRK